jgi:hypothetical protein
MKSIHSKLFLEVWRALYHQSNPGPTIDRWQLDGVEWVRETYRVGAREYAFHIETHLLTHHGGDPDPWSLLVVVERWWQRGRQDALKTSEWRQVLQGRDKQVLHWFERQRVRLDAHHAQSGPSVGK